MNYLDPFIAFIVPWLLILSFSLLPISDYAESLHMQTVRLAFVAIFTAILVAGSPLRQKYKRPSVFDRSKRLRFSVSKALLLLDILFSALTILNVVLAGYIPLFRGIATGNTEYIIFGIHGLYGFYLAFSNALAIFYFFIFLRTNNRRYLVRYLIIVLVFFLFVTRQNILSTVCETLVVYSFVRKKIRWRSIALAIVIMGLSFSLIGSFRSGNIKDLAGIKDQYEWIPDPLIWLYSYSYFSFANVDNLLVYSSAPYYNGSSLSQLIPSFLRPSYDMGEYLAIPWFNVSSYLYPIYEDAGVFGVVLLTAFALRSSAQKFLNLSGRSSFYSIGSYSVLYFCALFSFFVNFWFYLPIISQLIFMKFVSNLAEAVVDRDCAVAEERH